MPRSESVYILCFYCQAIFLKEEESEHNQNKNKKVDGRRRVCSAVAKFGSAKRRRRSEHDSARRRDASRPEPWTLLDQFLFCAFSRNSKSPIVFLCLLCFNRLSTGLRCISPLQLGCLSKTFGNAAWVVCYFDLDEPRSGVQSCLSNA